MELVTAAEMRALDHAAIETRKIPAVRLMENAGVAVVEAMEQHFGPLRKKRVLVVSGKGQNGGDGFVAARLLKRKGALVSTVLIGSPTSLQAAAAVNYKRWQAAGGKCHIITKDADLIKAQGAFQAADLIIDAVYGTGLNAPVTGAAAAGILMMNESARPIVAIDVPSGLNSDTGEVMGTAITAALTVTLARPKRGLYLGIGPNHTGAIRIADIGIPPDIIATAGIGVTLLDRASMRSLLHPRPRVSHKGTYGHAGIIAGSVGKTGAAAMAANAALRAGAGLVSVATPASVNDVLEGKLLEAMTVAVEETSARTLSLQAKNQLVTFAKDKTAVAIGPGLGRHPDTVKLVHQLLSELACPLVLDADALNAVSEERTVLRTAKAPVVVTPHPGEMARLTGLTTVAVQNDRLRAASTLAREQHVYVVLKGAGTVIADPDGRLAVNPTGNPGMATGGTGDVLTGIITGLLAQGWKTWDGACFGAYLHGLAGDLAARRVGETALIAGDVIASIPEAMQVIAGSPVSG